MIIVFCAGLIVGTVAGMFSWIAAAAVIEARREASEGLPAVLRIQPELAVPVRNYSIVTQVERTRQFFHASRVRVAHLVGHRGVVAKKQPPRAI